MFHRNPQYTGVDFLIIKEMLCAVNKKYDIIITGRELSKIDF